MTLHKETLISLKNLELYSNKDIIIPKDSLNNLKSLKLEYSEIKTESKLQLPEVEKFEYGLDDHYIRRYNLIFDYKSLEF